MACTVTTGGAMSGYCAMGNVRIAARPASAMKMDRTAAKIGRSMKKRENMLFLRRGFRFFFCLCFGNLHRGTRPDAHHAIGDHALAALQARGDDPGVAGPRAGLDRPRLGHALLVDDIDELALRPFEHRA